MCELIGDEATAAVAALTDLRQLDFSQNGPFTDVGVVALLPLTRLQSLVLSSSQVAFTERWIGRD